MIDRYNEYQSEITSTCSSEIKPFIWHINGNKLLENHPRFKGMRAAVDYLNIKQNKREKSIWNKLKKIWYFCDNLFDVGLVLVCVAYLVFLLVFAYI